MWAANGIFRSATYDLDDVLDSISMESLWDASNNRWAHEITIEYKPESPLGHTVVCAAAQALVLSRSADLSYCGCSPTAIITDTACAHNMAEPLDTSASSSPSKCTGAYKAGTGRKIRSTILALQAPTAPTFATFAFVAAAAVVLVVAGVFIMRQQIIHQAADNDGELETHQSTHALQQSVAFTSPPAAIGGVDCCA